MKESEQALTNKLKSEYKTMVESYEDRLQKLSSLVKTTEKNMIKEEQGDSGSYGKNPDNHLLDIQIIKDRLEQAQIDLGLF